MDRNQISIKISGWSLLILCFIVFNISGCAVLNCQGDYVVREKTAKFRITVTSTPSDADIYLNERFLGKTPARRIPIKINYKICCSGMLIATTGWNLCKGAGQYRYDLYVKKEGYETAGTTLKFVDLGRRRIGLEAYKYNADLLKKE